MRVRVTSAFAVGIVFAAFVVAPSRARGQGCAGPITISDSATGTTIVIANDIQHGWVISSVTAGGAQVPVAATPFWQAQLVNVPALQLVTIEPGAPGSGAVAASCSQLTASSVTLTWSLTNGPGPAAMPEDISGVVVNVNIAFPTGKRFALLDGSITVTRNSPLSATSHELALSRFDLLRITLPGTAGGFRDKLFVPMAEGAVVANYVDPGFNVLNGAEFYAPSSHTQCLQWWGAYYTAASPEGVLSYDHDLSASELLFFGSYDLQGWAKANRAVQVPGSGLLWEGGCIPPDDTRHTAGTLSYSSWANGIGVRWALGALPAGSGWSSLAQYYRSEFSGATWEYEREAPQTIAQQLSGAGALSTTLREASTMAQYGMPTGADGCTYTWRSSVNQDIDGIREVLVNNIGAPAVGVLPYSRTIASFYHHVIERSIVAQGLDKIVDLAHFCSGPGLTPNVQPTWLVEVLGITDPGVSSAFYVFFQGWDNTATTWCGSGGCTPPHPPQDPTIDLTFCPPGAAPCYDASLDPCVVATGTPLLKHSYIVNEFQKSISAYDQGCSDVFEMCPDSTDEYHTIICYAVAEYARQLRLNGLSHLAGAYIDNMGGRPLCYYETASPSGPPYQGFAHTHTLLNSGTTGGGRYFCAGRRRQFRDVRSTARTFTGDAAFFALSEFPAEHWVGVVDARGAYLGGIEGTPGGNTLIGDARPLSSLSSAWSPSAGSPLPFRVTAVPAFQMVYGDMLLTYSIGALAPEESIFLKDTATQMQANLPQAAVSGLVHPLHSGVLGAAALMGFNAYAIAAQAGSVVVDVDAYASSNSAYGAWNSAFFDVIPCPTWIGTATIGSPATVSDRWTNTLWVSASAFYLMPSLALNFKHQIMTLWDRTYSKMLPYHQNPDTAIGGALVNDSSVYRYLRRIQKAKSDWGDWVMAGRLCAQPVIDLVNDTGPGTACHDLVEKLIPELRDTSLCSAHGHMASNGTGVIVVTNWLPYSATFTVHFSTMELGVAASPIVTAFEPDIGIGGGCALTSAPGVIPPSGGCGVGPVGASAISGLVSFGTGQVPAGGVRIFFVN